MNNLPNSDEHGIDFFSRHSPEDERMSRTTSTRQACSYRVKCKHFNSQNPKCYTPRNHGCGFYIRIQKVLAELNPEGQRRFVQGEID